MAAAPAALAEQIQAARTYMNERYSHLDQHFSQTHAEFEDKMLQKHVVVESRLDQVTSALRTCEAQGSRTEAEIERVDSSGNDQRDHFVKMLAALEKTTEEHRVEAAAVMDDVKGRIAQNFAHFTNLVGSLEAKQTATDTKIEGTAQAVTDSRDKFTGLCARLEADQREDRRLSADSVSDLQGKLARDKTDAEPLDGLGDYRVWDSEHLCACDWIDEGRTIDPACPGNSTHGAQGKVQATIAELGERERQWREREAGLFLQEVVGFRRILEKIVKLRPRGSDELEAIADDAEQGIGAVRRGVEALAVHVPLGPVGILLLPVRRQIRAVDLGRRCDIEQGADGGHDVDQGNGRLVAQPARDHPRPMQE